MHRWASRIGFARLHCSALMSWQKRGSVKNYSDALQRLLNIAGVPASRVPEVSADELNSAVLRSYLSLADTIVHEFAHAFSLAYFEKILGDAIPAEPFVGSDRAMELGFATARHIFGGVAAASNFDPPAGAPPDTLQDIAAHVPFGITFREKWLSWAEPGTHGKHKHILEEGKEADFSEPIWTYSLSQRQVFDYFTDEMWETKVPRYGLQALRYVRIPEWATLEMPGPDPQRPWIGSTLK